MKLLGNKLLLIISIMGWLPISGYSTTESSKPVFDTEDTIPSETANTPPKSNTQIARYEQRTEKFQKFWASIVPNQTKLQFAGSIGMISAGIGWHYGAGHDRWETDLLLGYLPKFYSRKSKATMTIKQSYLPWHIDIRNSKLSFTPLTCGMFFNTVFGEEFWANQPSKYPKKYYGFSTKIRANIFLGQRFTYQIPKLKRRYNKSISAYYELSTCDLHLISYFTNKHINLGDITSLAIGLRFEFF